MHQSNQTHKFTSHVARTKILVALPMILQSFSFLLLKNGSWRNTCSKTLRAKEWKMEQEKRENGKSSSIKIAQDMVSWE